MAKNANAWAVFATLLCPMVAMSSGCAALGGRRQFAAHVAEGSAPIMKGYRACIAKDASLNEDEKRMRTRLADEFEKHVTEGAK